MKVYSLAFLFEGKGWKMKKLGELPDFDSHTPSRVLKLGSSKPRSTKSARPSGVTHDQG
jgi:hypothetical protein